MGKKAKNLPFSKMVTETLKVANQEEGMNSKEILKQIVNNHSIENNKSNLTLVTNELKKGLEAGEFLQVKGNSVHGTFKLNPMFGLPIEEEVCELPQPKASNTIENKAPTLQHKRAKKPPPSMRQRSPIKIAPKKDLPKKDVPKKEISIDDLISPEFFERAKNDPYSSIRQISFKGGQIQSVDLLAERRNRGLNKAGNGETNLDIDEDDIEEKKAEDLPKPINVEDHMSNIDPSVRAFLEDDSMLLNMIGGFGCVEPITTITGSIPSSNSNSRVSAVSKKNAVSPRPKKVSNDKPAPSKIIQGLKNVSTDKPEISKIVPNGIKTVSNFEANLKSAFTKKNNAAKKLEQKNESVKDDSKLEETPLKNPVVIEKKSNSNSKVNEKESPISSTVDKQLNYDSKVNEKESPISPTVSKLAQEKTLKEINQIAHNILDRGVIPKIVKNLSSLSIEKQKDAALTLTEFTRNIHYKIAIIKSNAIPALIQLISSTDLNIVESALVCLSNLLNKNLNAYKEFLFVELDSKSLGAALDRNFIRLPLNLLEISVLLVLKLIFSMKNNAQELANNFTRFFSKCLNSSNERILYLTSCSLKNLIDSLGCCVTFDFSDQEICCLIKSIKSKNKELSVLSLQVVTFLIINSYKSIPMLIEVGLLDILNDFIDKEEFVMDSFDCLDHIINYGENCAHLIPEKGLVNKFIKLGIAGNNCIRLKVTRLFVSLTSKLNWDDLKWHVDVPLFNTLFLMIHQDQTTDEELRPYMKRIHDVYARLNF